MRSHLSEQGQQHNCELGHRVVRVGRVDSDRVRQVAYPDSAFGQFVDQVQGVAHGSPESVQGVHHDHVSVAGVLHDRAQSGAVDRGPGLLVHIDAIGVDVFSAQGVDLPIQVLFDRRHPRVPQLHAVSVPKVVSELPRWDAIIDFTFGTHFSSAEECSPGPTGTVPQPRNWDGRLSTCPARATFS